jgi:hypothetical protein
MVFAWLSVTCTDVENAPVPVGVPLMMPLLDKLRPGGIALPAATAYVYAGLHTINTQPVGEPPSVSSGCVYD